MSAVEPGRDENHTAVTEFILLGFGRSPGLQLVPFVIFLMIYTITVLGNITLFLTIKADSRLHTPMYFFLMNLSFLDFCYSSTIAPRAIVSFLPGSKIISYRGCATQLFFFSFFITTEAFLLAVMAYDRYAAICNPLLYSAAMSKPVCIQLLVGCYICGSLNSMLQMSFTFTLRFCASEIDHFFCDFPPLINLSCTNTYINQMVLFLSSGLIIVITSLIILLSYAYIISAVLQMHSAVAQRKTFSTCTSHIVVVSLFYGTVTFMYAQPSSLSSPDQGKVVSVFYTLVIPMLNPFIYSLRNKEVKEALRKTAGWILVLK